LAPAEDITNEDIIGTYNSAIKSRSNSNGFFYDTAFVGVRYLNDPDVPVKEFLLSCRIYSEALAREK
jgi:hypothetical protein